MIIDENNEVYNNVPKNAIGFCKEFSIIELKNFLKDNCIKYHWGLYKYYNMLQCAINRGLIENKEEYRWIAALLDREADIEADRKYYRDNQ